MIDIIILYIIVYNLSYQINCQPQPPTPNLQSIISSSNQSSTPTPNPQFTIYHNKSIVNPNPQPPIYQICINNNNNNNNTILIILHDTI